MTRSVVLALASALALTGWHGIGYCQSPVSYVMVGGKAIAIRAPDGFIEPRIVKPKTAAAINALTPSRNRNLSYLITLDDLRRIESGLEPKLERVLRIEVLKEGEMVDFSAAQFNAVKEKVRRIELSAGTRNLGSFDETRYSISFLAVGNGTITATSILHVQGKSLYAFVQVLEGIDPDGAWAKEISKTLVRLVLEANKQPVDGS